MISDDESTGWSRGNNRTRRTTSMSSAAYSVASDDEFDDLMYEEIKKSVSSGNGNTMGMARKAFLLDQLSRPAPGKNQSAGTRKIREAANNLNHVKPKAPKKRAKRGVDRRLSVDRLHSRMTGVCSRLEREHLFVAKQMGEKSFWPLIGFLENKVAYNRKFAAGVLQEVSRTILEMHQNETGNGALDSKSVLMDRNLDVYLEEPNAVGVKGGFNVKRMQSDMLNFGVLIVEILSCRPVGSSFCPNLADLKAMANGITSAKLDVSQVEKEVKEVLKSVPRYLQEHCLALLSADGSDRPDATMNFKQMRKYKSNLGSEGDDDEKLRILKHVITDTKVVRFLKKNPKIVGNGKDEPPRRSMSSRRSEAKSSSRSRNSDASNSRSRGSAPRSNGYESDDSYYVEPKPEDKKKRKPRKSGLRDFLNATADTSAPPEEPSSQSHNGEIMRRKSRYSDFTDIDDEDDAPRQRRTRRRSLDQDYLAAKQTLERDVKAGVGITPDNLKAFKDAWAAKEKARELRRGKMKPEKIAKKFEKQIPISLNLCMAICKRATAMLREEPNNVQLDGPVTVVGDIHGQFFDLRNLFKQCGLPGEIVGDGTLLDAEGNPLRRTYVFLGDYVDRGNFSCEVLLYLFALKCEFQTHVWLLRGNHESRATSGYFGFQEECERKYGVELFNKCCDAFQAMPLAATVSTPAGKFFCLHGGISPNVTELYQFAEIDRFAEPDMKGFLCDVLWADPVAVAHEDDDDELDAVDKRQALGSYFPNTLRGCSYRFGLAALQDFLNKNGLVSIIRAHQVQHYGYHYHFQELVRSQLSGKASQVPIDQITPPVITVFSAPNYCGTYDNKAAYINIGYPMEAHANRTPKKPLEAIVPVQFDAVEEPRLIEIVNAKKQNELDIEKMCPYMPMDANSFIARSIQLRELDSLDELINKEIDYNEINLELIDKEEEEQLDQVMPKRLEKFPSVRAEDPSTWKSIAERKKEFQRAASKYKDAQKKDRMNEMNPLKLAKLEDKAKKQVASSKEQLKHLPSNIRIKDEERRRASKRMSQRLSRQLSQKEISFTQKELVSLQALFLLIDRDEKGKIGAFDLVLWSEGEGMSCSPQEAYVALEIVDFDKDGFIGFEDYLVFAACAKKLWLAEKFAKILQRNR